MITAGGDNQVLVFPLARKRYDIHQTNSLAPAANSKAFTDWLEGLTGAGHW